MGRPRLTKNRGLPDNLYFDPQSRLYRYRNPVSRKLSWLNRDRAECVRAAKKLNAMLLPAASDLVQRVVGGGQSVAAIIDSYDRDILPELDLAPKTEAQYRAYHRRLRQTKLAKMGIADVGVRDIALCLNEVTEGRRMRNIYRHRLVCIMAYAQEEGWCDGNPAAATRILKVKRLRDRLTLEGYRAIYPHAPPYCQAGMDLILQTLQRPEDVVMLRYDDEVSGRLRIQQRKTGTRLSILVSPQLREVIEASRDGKPCPFIVHDLPRRLPKREDRAQRRQHHMQVFEDKLSRAFREARNVSGFYRRSKHPPSLYEIKSLGGDRYRAMGWSEQQVQALMGHKDVAMTREYLDGHEEPWQEVESGLSL